MMMKALISLSLLAACAADMPSRRMQAATTTPPPTTTPGTTVTTTPGASFQSTTTVSASSRRLSSSDGRRLTALPPVSPTFMAKAYCSALQAAGGYCTATATLNGNVWTIIATITTTAGGSAATQTALNALTATSVGTAITTFLVAEKVIDQADVSKFQCTKPSNKGVPAQPYVPPPAPVSFGMPPFKLSFTIAANGFTMPSLTPQQESAIEADLNAHNPFKDWMGYEVDLEPTAINVKTSVVVPTTMVNNIHATINEIEANGVAIQNALNAEFQKNTPNFTGSVVILNWNLSSVPTGSDPTKGTSLVNFSSLVNSRLYEKEQQEGNFFDVDDDAEDDAKDEKTVGSVASWTMPTLGVVALVTAVALIGFSMRRRTQSLSAYTPVSSSAMGTETPIENELESPLE